MAKQVINIGTTANDGTGDSLRVAFDKCNDNFTELYTDDAGDVGSIIAGTGISVNSATGDVTVTNSAPDQTVALTGGTGISTSGTYPNFTITNDSPNATHTGDVTGATALTIAADAVDGSKIADDSIDSEHLVDGSIDTAHIADDAVTADKLANSINTEIAANTAKTSNATHTGEVTGATALTIANDAVTHDKIENRYTALASITTLTGTVAFDMSTATTFKLSGDLTGAYTINLSNYKKGQVITIFPLKAQSITLAAQGSSTNTFNKIGGDYDNTAFNVLQLECVDDSATDPIFFYSIATFTSDNTP